MKRGFTLAELLVSLGIIGVIAAMTIPMLAHIRPNDTKIKYMRVYNAINEITQAALDNSELYRSVLVGVEESCVGLNCTARPNIQPYKSMSGWNDNAKYAIILAQNLNVDDSLSSFGSSSSTFYTNDGAKWIVTSSREITVDIDGTDKGKNCTYGSSCKRPDIFKFSVDEYGAVTPKDNLGKVFIKNASSGTSLEDDIKEAG